MPRILPAIALMVGALLMGGCGSATAEGVLFPDALTAPVPDRPPVTIRLGGNEDVLVTSVRFEPRPDRTQARNVFWCGVTVAEAGAAAQPIVTIGTGNTEALSCDGMAEIGEVPGPKDGRAIGVVYRARSPNTEVLTAIILVRRGADRTWVLDENLSERMVQRPGLLSLSGIRAALRPR